MKKLILIMLLTGLAGCVHANPFKGLLTFKAADEIKAADKITGIEKVADKAALVDNSKSSVSDARAGRDVTQTNDSELMKEYIQAIKDGNAKLIDIMWKIIGLLIVQLIGIIGAFGGYLFFTVKSLLSARDKDDENENRRIDKLLSKGGEKNG